MVSCPPLAVPVPPQMLPSVVPLSAATSVQLVTWAVLVLARVMLAQYPPPHESTVMVALTPLVVRFAADGATLEAPSGAWPQAIAAAPSSRAVSINGRWSFMFSPRRHTGPPCFGSLPWTTPASPRLGGA